MFPCGLLRKSHITPVIDNWLTSSKTGINADMQYKRFMCDGDRSNYNSGKFTSMLHGHGVSKAPTPEYEAAYNGLIERAQGILDSMALAFIDYAELDLMSSYSTNCCYLARRILTRF